MLLDALDAKLLGDDRFEAHSIEYLRPRVFGSELLAEVLATAARRLQNRACHAIHVDFLFPSDPKIPIEYGATAGARAGAEPHVAAQRICTAQDRNGSNSALLLFCAIFPVRPTTDVEAHACPSVAAVECAT
jgi:acyl-CoA thioesterase